MADRWAVPPLPFYHYCCLHHLSPRYLRPCPQIRSCASYGGHRLAQVLPVALGQTVPALEQKPKMTLASLLQLRARIADTLFVPCLQIMEKRLWLLLLLLLLLILPFTPRILSRSLHPPLPPSPQSGTLHRPLCLLFRNGYIYIFHTYLILRTLPHPSSQPPILNTDHLFSFSASSELDHITSCCTSPNVCLPLPPFSLSYYPHYQHPSNRAEPQIQHHNLYSRAKHHCQASSNGSNHAITSISIPEAREADLSSTEARLSLFSKLRVALASRRLEPWTRSISLLNGSDSNDRARDLTGFGALVPFPTHGAGLFAAITASGHLLRRVRSFLGLSHVLHYGYGRCTFTRSTGSGILPNPSTLQRPVSPWLGLFVIIRSIRSLFPERIRMRLYSTSEGGRSW